MTTRAEALARARANIQPGIDASRAQVETLGALVASRVQAVYDSPAVTSAQASWVAGIETVELRRRTLDERIQAGLDAPAVQNPLANELEAKTTLAQREANLRDRLAAINAYFDELERRQATASIVDQPPAEAA